MTDTLIKPFLGELPRFLSRAVYFDLIDDETARLIETIRQHYENNRQSFRPDRPTKISKKKIPNMHPPKILMQIFGDDPVDSAIAQQFSTMIYGSNTTREQALALQITLGQRINQLRIKNEEQELAKKLNSVISIARAGDLHGALKRLEEV